MNFSKKSICFILTLLFLSLNTSINTYANDGIGEQYRESFNTDYLTKIKALPLDFFGKTNSYYDWERPTLEILSDGEYLSFYELLSSNVDAYAVGYKLFKIDKNFQLKKTLEFPAVANINYKVIGDLIIVAEMTDSSDEYVMIKEYDNDLNLISSKTYSTDMDYFRIKSVNKINDKYILTANLDSWSPDTTRAFYVDDTDNTLKKIDDESAMKLHEIKTSSGNGIIKEDYFNNLYLSNYEKSISEHTMLLVDSKNKSDIKHTIFNDEVISTYESEGYMYVERNKFNYIENKFEEKVTKTNSEDYYEPIYVSKAFRNYSNENSGYSETIFIQGSQGSSWRNIKILNFDGDVLYDYSYDLDSAQISNPLDTITDVVQKSNGNYLALAIGFDSLFYIVELQVNKTDVKTIDKVDFKIIGVNSMEIKSDTNKISLGEYNGTTDSETTFQFEVISPLNYLLNLKLNENISSIKNSSRVFNSSNVTVYESSLPENKIQLDEINKFYNLGENFNAGDNYHNLNIILKGDSSVYPGKYKASFTIQGIQH